MKENASGYLFSEHSPLDPTLSTPLTVAQMDVFIMLLGLRTNPVD